MNRRVLIVEDNLDIGRNLHDLLESEGYEAEVATDGQMALEKLSACRELPSVILLDLMMPRMDGFQFRAAQVKEARIAGVPIVIMTADGHIEIKKEKIGAMGFIRKPLDIDDVLRTVERFAK